MNKRKTFLITLFCLICNLSFCLQVFSATPGDGAISEGPDKDYQILFNGKIWYNLYNSVKGDQFMFSRDFLDGTISMNGQPFKNVSLLYDIYNDELIIPTNHGAYLQLNKEMVDSFTLSFNNRIYRFLNTQKDSLRGIKGYVNVLYKGASSLYVKYKKEIDLLAVDDKYDLFYQTYHIYFVKKGIVYQINNKRDFLKAVEADKPKIKDFLRKNKIRLTKKMPDSFTSVVRYYDSLGQ